MERAASVEKYFSADDDDDVEVGYSEEEEDSQPSKANRRSASYKKNPNDVGEDIDTGLDDTHGDLENDVDEDEKNINMSFTSNMDDAESNPTPMIMENGVPDEDSSDDELLVNRKTLKKASESKVPKKKPLKKTTGGGSKVKKVVSKVQKNSKERKRKVREASTVEGQDDEEDEDEVMAAVVVNDAASECESLDAEVVAVAEVVTKESKRLSTPGRKRRRRRSPQHSTSESAGKVRRKPGPQPGWKKKQIQRKSLDMSSDESAHGQKEIPAQKREAAERSRDILLHSVEHLPFVASESVIVRNFGRLKEEDEKNPLDVLYSSPSALYPVGYSCDRYEFSPIHGRLIKLRCEILNGSKYANLLTESRTDHPLDEFYSYDGPIFRILWGKAIDEWDFDRSIPFDLGTMAAPLGASESDTTINTRSLQPESGMRVKVRFDDDTWYKGILGEVISHDVTIDEKSSRKKGSNVNQSTKQSFTAQILYDDGSTEQLDLPDPDVILLIQDSDDDALSLNLESLRGKVVSSVVGKSPIEAWGKALIKLGLLDEVSFDRSRQSMADARLDSLSEADDRLATLNKQRREARARHNQKLKDKAHGKGSVESSFDASPVLKNDDSLTNENKTSDEGGILDGVNVRDLLSYREEELKANFDDTMTEFEQLTTEAMALANELGRATVGNIWPHLMYPFSDDDTVTSILAAIVKKEKNRMGSTGSRRKVVSATDLLEKSSSFFNYGIERLIEGLPGSENASTYVFHELRGPNATGVNQSWVFDILSKLRKQKRSRASFDDADNLDGYCDGSETGVKSRSKVDEREIRKKQKLEELEREKQIRKEERLSRLSNQIDERLMKEASLAREKIMGIYTKALTKEYNRRRRAAELVTMHKVESTRMDVAYPRLLITDLPPLSKEYDLDVVRIWNFITTYKGAFKSVQHNIQDLDLDSLQSSLDCLRSDSSVGSDRKDAMATLCNLAIALCKPISIGLVKTLSSTLTSNQQEKFTDSASAHEKSDPDPFPVNLHTWKEIARLSLLSDGLNEVGYSKQDQAHILRGFRSGGHPLSKQAKKLRRGEDYALVLQQQLLQSTVALGGNRPNPVKVRVPVPSKPTSGPNDWTLFLHNVISLPVNAVSGMKANIRKAVSVLKTAPKEGTKTSGHEEILKNLQNAASLLDPIGETITTPSQMQDICNTVRDRVLVILNNFQESSQAVKDTVSHSTGSEICSPRPTNRSRIGFVQTLNLSREMHKRYIHKKEDYMGSALKLKADLDRKKAKLENEDDTDEEEEEVDLVQPNQSPTKPTATSLDAKKIGKVTDYDDFCGDDPNAPEPIRRCLAVLRTLCGASPADPFIFPVDPQANPKYYDTILRPMSLYDAGKILQSSVEIPGQVGEIDNAVTDLGRNVRLIYQNCMCYSNIGGSIISAAEEMIRIFERLFFDWVLAPEDQLPPLGMLDDDYCVEHHDSDDDCNVLICDGCEGKFNMSRLSPPLDSVPNGDWYCPRCLNGRCWSIVDPRINMNVRKQVDNFDSNSIASIQGQISRCIVSREEGEAHKSTLSYVVSFNNDHEIWSLEMVDKALTDAGCPVPPIRCLEAVAESPGYGMGTDNGLVLDILPAPLNPHVSDIAAQKSLSSSFFSDTIVLCATLLLLEVQELSASEWIRLLALLVMKCTSSESFQEEISNLENESITKFNSESSSSKISRVYDVLPLVSDVEDEDNPISSSVDAERRYEPLFPYSQDETESHKDSGNPSVRSLASGNTQDRIGVSAEIIDTDNAAEAVVTPFMILDENGSTDDKESKRIKMLTVASAKNDRQKAREDSFLAHSVKLQLKSTIASFEEDNVTQVVDNILAHKGDGLRLSDCRCPSYSCDFCGLSDVALGTPLIRVPNDHEWLDIMSHIAARRRIFLAAEISPNNHSTNSENTKLVLVKIRVGNKLISSQFDSEEGVDNTEAEFLPRCSTGFQHELRCRLQDGLSFVSGSLSAHECCALAAHKSRCDKILIEGKERALEDMERDFGSFCGRSLPLGCDESGRSYWKFSIDPHSLFVLVPINDSHTERVQRYTKPECIASVIVSLGGAYPSAVLIKAFPEAQRVLRGRLWVSLLQNRLHATSLKEGALEDHDKNSSHLTSSSQSNPPKDEECCDIPFTKGEDVLVEDSSGKLLWHATIVNTVSKEKGKVDAYRVHYKEWSTRFDEWVKPIRVVEPSAHNILVQGEYLREMMSEKAFVPESLNLTAKSFINEPRRARGTTPAPIFFDLFPNKNSRSAEHRPLDCLKFGILLVEAALPNGSLNTSSDEGLCSPDMVATWRSMVIQAKGPRSLAGCLILLENSIRKQWFRPDTEQLLMCMHRPFKAVNEATDSSIALRLWLLDRVIKYSQIEE